MICLYTSHGNDLGDCLVRCPYCGYEGINKIKSWKFRFYNVTMIICPKCGGKFNYYIDTRPKGRKKSDFVIRLTRTKAS